MHEDLSMYWQHLCHLNKGQLQDIINDASQPALRVGLALALKNFAETGDFDTLEKISDAMFMADIDDDFYEDGLDEPSKN